MPNEKSATVDFLNTIGNEEPFKEEVTKEDEETIEAEPDDKVPFHKDPKVQRFVEKQVEKALKERGEPRSAEQQFRKEVDEDIKLPASFIKLVGNDTDEKRQVLKDLSSYFGTLKGEARQEFVQEMQEQQRQLDLEDQAATKELDDAFESIEETYSVDLSSNSTQAKQLREQFIEFVRKVAPKNEDGEVKSFPDLISTFEEFQERVKKPPTRAKELASRGMTRSTESSPTPQGKSWRDVDKYFEKLKAQN